MTQHLDPCGVSSNTRIHGPRLASLAVAIGLNVLIFCFTSPVLFKGMPYPEPDRLLDVSMAPPGKPESKGVVTPALYLLLRDKAERGLRGRRRLRLGAIGEPRGRRQRVPQSDWTGIGFRRRPSRRSAPDRCSAGSRPPPMSRLTPRPPCAQLPGLAAALRRPCGSGRPDRAGRWTANPDHRRHAGGLRTPRQFIRCLFPVQLRAAPRTGVPAQPSRGRPPETWSVDGGCPGGGEGGPRRVRAEIPDPRQGLDRRAHAMARGAIRRHARGRSRMCSWALERSSSWCVCPWRSWCVPERSVSPPRGAAPASFSRKACCSRSVPG